MDGLVCPNYTPTLFNYKHRTELTINSHDARRYIYLDFLYNSFFIQRRFIYVIVLNTSSFRISSIVSNCSFKNFKSSQIWRNVLYRIPPRVPSKDKEILKKKNLDTRPFPFFLNYIINKNKIQK